jgi:23S rRNA pseudouridine1911/1915/1917 synthase
MTSLVVQASEAGLRLDGLLAHRRVVASVSAARRALASGIVRVNSRVAKKGMHLQPGDTVELCDGPVGSLVLQPTEDSTLSLLYVDDDLVAVDKPGGIASHPLRPGDGPSVASAIVSRFPECAQASPDPREGGLGHRLDVATSGVLLAARSREAWHRLREALATPFCEKTYVAETRGCFPVAEEFVKEFVVPGPRASSFVVTVPIGRQGRRGRKVKLASGRQPLPARSEIDRIEEREHGTLVEARLAQGRAHQVRAHLAYLGIPVMGDTIYGQIEEDVEEGADTSGDGSGLRLHAWTVSFVHPTTGKPMRIEAPLPPWARRRS